MKGAVASAIVNPHECSYPINNIFMACVPWEELQSLERSNSTEDSKGNQLTLTLMMET